MVVGEHGVDAGLLAQRRGFRAVPCLEHLYAPLSQQRLHPVENGAVIVDAQYPQALQVAGVRRGYMPVGAAAPPRTDVARYPDSEQRAAAGMAGDRQGMLHEPGQPIVNRQAEAETLLTPGRVM